MDKILKVIKYCDSKKKQCEMIKANIAKQNGVFNYNLKLNITTGFILSPLPEYILNSGCV